MLILDVFDDWIPAAVVVDQISETRRVHDVETKTNTVLFDHVRDGMDLGGATNGFGWRQATLGLYKMRREDGVDQS